MTWPWRRRERAPWPSAEPPAFMVEMAQHERDRADGFPLLEVVAPAENPRGNVHGRLCEDCGAQVPDLPRAVELHRAFHERLAGAAGDRAE